MTVITAGAVLLLVLASVQQTPAVKSFEGPVYGYECKTGLCLRAALKEGNPENLQALSVCKQQCKGHGNLWPQPTGLNEIGKQLAAINVKSIISKGRGFKPSEFKTLNDAFTLFRTKQLNKTQNPDGTAIFKTTGNSLVIEFNVTEPKASGLELNPDESYELQVKSEDKNTIQATITANNFYGARHAMETLHQLIVVDDIRKELRLPDSVHITDRPAYPYRGILLDTARTFMSIESLKRLIDAMGASKLNNFHWHITDYQSFPFESKSYPNLTRFGAYSNRHVYTEAEIKSLVQYARIRGVRIVPELDAPAHVGEGWYQSVPKSVVCFKAQPWRKFCLQPPCGQLDPTRENVYEILEGLYRDMLRAFEPTVFHMGGDEVDFHCWNTTQTIQAWFKERKLSNTSEESFHDMWNYFQTKALKKLESANGGEPLPVVLWTSTLTGKGAADKYLDPKKYIIQIWTKGNDTIIGELARKKFRLIFSNHDALYLNCGYGAWIGTGNNWCSPYIGWQKVYDNDPRTLVKNAGVTDEESLKLVLGAEAALWTEQANPGSIGSKIWPRAAAMAERLWSNPASDWAAAEHRFLEHTQRLIDLGVQPDAIEPQWCRLNEGSCY